MAPRPRGEKEIDALPQAPVVSRHEAVTCDATRDEIVEWLAVPGWQGLARLEK